MYPHLPWHIQRMKLPDILAHILNRHRPRGSNETRICWKVCPSIVDEILFWFWVRVLDVVGEVEIALSVPAGFRCDFGFEPRCVCVAVASAIDRRGSALEDVDFYGVFGNFW
jgi:hypothetical protein